MTKYIDSHVHLDFYTDIDATVKSLVNSEVTALFATHLPELYISYSKKSHMFKNTIIALGHHPNLLDEYPFDSKMFDMGLKTAKAISEVGLDYFITKSEHKRKKQKQVFEYICKSAEYRIMSIHSRKAEDDVLGILVKSNVKKAIFHWYTGKVSLIKDILQNGYYFSLNPAMLTTVSGNKIIPEIPVDRVLIESDGPFSKFNGKITSPEQFPEIYNDFAKRYNMPTKEFIKQIMNNFYRLNGKENEMSNN